MRRPKTAFARIMTGAAALGALVLSAGCGSDGGPTRPGEWDPDFPVCTPYETPPIAAAPGTKFALSVYHYNVQYVPGGLQGFMEGPEFDMTHEEVEDAIVTEGLEPVVDMYLRHPTWGADLEMQGYMVEVMAARHPGVLEKLRTLLAAGQVHLASVHYSDQLFLAYPASDMLLSLARNDQALETGCVEASPTIFTQEGQFGEGLLELLWGQGRRYAALPKNLFGYLHPELERQPLYVAGDMNVVLAGQGIDQGEVSLRWTFCNDGELATSAQVAGGPTNPYFGRLFVADPEVTAAHEQEIADLEAEGYAVTNIASAVEAIRALPGYESPPALPPILDCDWQPKDTTMLLRWMGDMGLNTDAERDNAVLTANTVARRQVLAAQVLIDHARRQGADVAQSEVDAAYALRHLLWAEVSDSTGWNPIANEVGYSLTHAGQAQELAEAILEDLTGALGLAHVAVDLASGDVQALNELPAEPDGDPAEAPLEITVSTSRPYTTTWTSLGEGHSRLVVRFDTAPVGRGGAVSVSFPWTGEEISYSPALAEETVATYARTEFAPTATLALPLANGLIGLGDDWWVIKDVTTVHVAAVLAPDAGSIVFGDNTFPGTEKAAWRFEVIQGPPETALARANALNVWPVVRR